MNIKDVLGITTGVIALMGIGYTAALKGRYIINDAVAQQIFAQLNAPDEIERLEFQREYKQNQLRSLQRIEKENRSEEDQDTIEELKADITLLKSRLAKLKGQEE